MPSEVDDQTGGAAVRALADVLRDDAERIREYMCKLELLATNLEDADSVADDQGHAQVISAIACHRLNCVIKLGWAAKAMAMLHDALSVR